MQYVTPLDKFHPDLQPVLQEFARKSHARNLLVVGSWPTARVGQLDSGEIKESDYRKANFYDPRFPIGGRSGEWEYEAVGTVKLVKESDEVNFVVSSRLIKNEKYRKNSQDYKTKTSKTIIKVVKTMVDTVIAYRYSEIYKFHEKRMKELISNWRNETYKTIQSAFGYYSTEQALLYEEVKHLRDIGVKFKTAQFNKMATEGIGAYEEYKQRNKQRLARYHVLIIDNRISVTRCEEDEHLEAGTPQLAYACDGFELMNDDVSAEVAMLKMLEVGKEIPGVGVRVSERDFLVMKPLASTTNA